MPTENCVVFPQSLHDSFQSVYEVLQQSLRTAAILIIIVIIIIIIIITSLNTTVIKSIDAFLPRTSPVLEEMLSFMTSIVAFIIQTKNLCSIARFHSMDTCLFTYLRTYLLIPCSRVLLEKLSGLQLVKKFPAFYGTRRFITAFTSARHLSLS
jgi:hypothetical protein